MWNSVIPVVLILFNVYLWNSYSFVWFFCLYTQVFWFCEHYRSGWTEAGQPGAGEGLTSRSRAQQQRTDNFTRWELMLNLSVNGSEFLPVSHLPQCWEHDVTLAVRGQFLTVACVQERGCKCHWNQYVKHQERSYRTHWDQEFRNRIDCRRILCACDIFTLCLLTESYSKHSFGPQGSSAHVSANLILHLTAPMSSCLQARSSRRTEAARLSHHEAIHYRRKDIITL